MQRYFITAESTYESLRQSLNTQLGYPNALGKSVFQTALLAPRDGLRRVLLAVDTDLPGYATISAAIDPLLASDAMEEIDQATYLAAIDTAGAGGTVTISDVSGLQTALDGKAALAHTHSASAITDFSSAAIAAVTWTTLTGKPTFSTVATTGAYSDLSGRPTLGTAAAAATTDFAAASHTQAWSTITSTPTTLAGYGITNGLTASSLASPPAIGGTAPAAGSFTVLAASTSLAVPSGASGTPAAGHLYRSADTIRYRDSGNVERLLLNSADNLANLGSTATARSNLGLGSAATAASSDFAAASHSHAASAITSGTLDIARLPVGQTSTTVAAGNDARFTDARAPTSHASSHASGGSDAISLAASQITSGTIAAARLGTGTADATTFLRGDGTFATPSASVTYATTAQAQDLTATTVAMNPANVLSALRTWTRVIYGVQYTVNGASTSLGGAASPILQGQLTTSSSAASSSCSLYAPGSGWQSAKGVSADWTRPIAIATRVYRQVCPANGVFRYLFGQLSAGGFAYETLSGRGIGFEIRQTRIWLIVHNGTTLSQVDTGIDGVSTDYSGTATDFLVRSDAAGNVTLTVNVAGGSAQTFTTTGGPTTQTSAASVPYAGLTNGASASQAQFWFFPHLLYLP